MTETRKVRTRGLTKTRKVSRPIYSSLLPSRHPPVLTFRVFGGSGTRRAGRRDGVDPSSERQSRADPIARRGNRSEHGRESNAAKCGHRGTAARIYQTNMLPWVLHTGGVASGLVTSLDAPL
jgi:hypothetical protein